MNSGCVFYNCQTVCTLHLFAACGVFGVCFVDGSTFTSDDEHVVSFNYTAISSTTRTPRETCVFSEQKYD